MCHSCAAAVLPSGKWSCCSSKHCVVSAFYMEVGRGGFEAVPGFLLSFISSYPRMKWSVISRMSLLPFPNVSHTLLWSCLLLPGQAQHCPGTWHPFFPVTSSAE